MKKEIIIRITIEIPDDDKVILSDDALLSHSVWNIEWPKYSRVRILNAMKEEGIETVGDLIKWNEWELLRIPNLGRKALNDIKNYLSSIGFGLRQSPRIPFSKWDKELKEFV